MTAQVDLFGNPANTDRTTRPVIRRVDLQDAKTVRTNYGTFSVVAVNSDRTVTIQDQPGHVPHVIPFDHIEGTSR